MADVLSDAGDVSGEEESQEDVMTSAELISKLEEVLNQHYMILCLIIQSSHHLHVNQY